MNKLLVLTTLMLGALTSQAANSSQKSKGFIDINVYPYLTDVTNDSVFTINLGANLSDNLSYFSLNNFYNQGDKHYINDLDDFYTEQNLRWKFEGTPFDATMQANFRTGQDNDRHRLGLRWRLNDTSALEDFFSSIHLKYAINFHLIQFDNDPNDVWQMEHAYFMKFPYLSDKLYLSGFIDHTFNETTAPVIPNNPVVSETQLGYQLTENFYLVAEWRINQYRRTDVNNTAIGIQYKVVF